MTRYEDEQAHKTTYEAALSRLLIVPESRRSLSRRNMRVFISVGQPICIKRRCFHTNLSRGYVLCRSSAL